MDTIYIIGTGFDDYLYTDNLETAKEFLKKTVLEIEKRAVPSGVDSIKVWSEYRDDGLCADIFSQTLGVFVNGYARLVASVKIHEIKSIVARNAQTPNLPPRKKLCGGVEIIEDYQESSKEPSESSEYATSQAENLYTAIERDEPSGFHTGVSRLYSILPTLNPKENSITKSPSDSYGQKKGSYVWV